MTVAAVSFPTVVSDGSATIETRYATAVHDGTFVLSRSIDLNRKFLLAPPLLFFVHSLCFSFLWGEKERAREQRGEITGASVRTEMDNEMNKM